ncbi:MAG: hypothetical protein AABN33_05050 [Acidobacteriota bacterium]
MRKRDVELAAIDHHLDSARFLDEIDRSGVVPLAVKPITVRFLLDIFHENGGFPNTQRELYQQGCRRLCEEPDKRRREDRRVTSLTGDQRLAVASRIAALMIFSNQYAVWTDVDLGGVPDDMHAQQLCGGVEAAGGMRFECTEAAIRETLATGLFSARGPDRMGWAHQTYAEFLAARYLVEHGIQVSQILGLLRHPNDPNGKLIPQLHETAAWLGGMSNKLFQGIMDVEADVLLRSDVASADLADREALVGTLLNLYEAEQLLDTFAIRTQYRKLKYDGLACQLLPYLEDKERGIICRRAAADIAEACDVKELQNELADIALDRADSYGIRVNAASAVLRIGDNETKRRLEPLIEADISEDPDQDLKGYALQAIWPDSPSAQALFEVLAPVHRESYSGSYEYFLRYELVKKLKPIDLPVALRWVESQQPRRDLSYDCCNLIDEIMLKGWRNLELPGLIESFARAVRSRLVFFDDIVDDNNSFRGLFGPGRRSMSEHVLENQERRRLVLDALLNSVTDENTDFRWLATSKNTFLSQLDLHWMAEKLQTATGILHTTLARMLSRVFDWRDPDHVDTMYRAIQESKALAVELRWFFGPIQLDSEVARSMREEYTHQLTVEQQERNPPVLSPPPHEQILTLLDICESGQPVRWWQICRLLALEPTSVHWGDEYQADITQLPGWKAADGATKQRLIAIAHDYLHYCGDDTSRWIAGDSLIFLDSWAGYKALVLLLKESPTELAKLGADRWREWLPVILLFPLRDDGWELNQKLVKLANQVSESVVIDATSFALDHNHCPLRRVECCWSQRLADSLTVKLKEQHLKPTTTSHILAHLLDHDSLSARAFAEEIIATLEARPTIELETPEQDLNWLTVSSVPKIDDERERGIVIGITLAVHGEIHGRRVVWKQMQSDPSFGDEVIGRITNNDRRAKRLLHELAVDELVDLYLWLVRRYPYSPSSSSYGFFGEVIGGLGSLRDAVLVELRQRGTLEACHGMQRIAHACPELDWMKWQLREAWDTARRQTWMPVSPEYILNLVSNTDNRLVQNSQQLLDVVIESLTRLQTRLQGETPAVSDLWNDLPDGGNSSDKPMRSEVGRIHRRRVSRPKDENHLADYVKRELERDLTERGIVINREVRIHRGERTDIHVNAVTLSGNMQEEPFGVATVIIETKGCWNRDLDDSMKTQLVDRYLQDNKCKHGLYLVGWFNCDQWDGSDYRKQVAPRITMEKAQQRYSEQAVDLSVGDIRVAAFMLDTSLH